MSEGLIRLNSSAPVKLIPPEPRTLGAIHLATALSVGRELGGIISYDARLSDAASSSDITVLTPGKED